MMTNFQRIVRRHSSAIGLALVGCVLAALYLLGGHFQVLGNKLSNQVNESRDNPPPDSKSGSQNDQGFGRHWITGILASGTGLGNRLFHAASLYGLARASGSHIALFFPVDHLPCNLFGLEFISSIY